MRALPSLLLFFAACAPPPFDPSALADDGQPHIDITWPLNEGEVAGCTYVTVNVRNFTLVDPDQNPTPAEGYGHFHLEYPTTSGTIGYGKCTRPYCLVDLAKAEGPAQIGTINFEARLVGNDHVPVTNVDGEPVTSRIPVDHVSGPCEEGGGMDSGDW